MLGFGAFGRREPSGSVKALRSNPMAKAAALLSNRQRSLPSPIRPRSDPLQGPAVLRDAEPACKRQVDRAVGAARLGGRFACQDQ